jgi:2-(1,2-epoxy-1,2-dihydrophenyl)acetyl-CoA isomerase
MTARHEGEHKEGAMTTITYSTILLEISDGVAEITLNRPEAANALSAEMARELYDAVLRCDADAAVRAVLITGNGRFFCAGGDLKSFAAQGDDLPRHLKQVTGDFHAAVSRLNRMDAPVVIAVNGVAAGAGFSFALVGDLAVAAESARFTMAYTRAGLSPDGSSTYFLPRIVGLRRAKELTLTNRTLTAAEAQEWGIVNQVVADAELLATTRALARELAGGATQALGTAKRLLDSGLNATLETAMEDEAQAISALARTDDGREGIQAFLEKRAAAFHRR